VGGQKRRFSVFSVAMPRGGSTLGWGHVPADSLVAPRFKSQLEKFSSDLKFQYFHINANFLVLVLVQLHEKKHYLTVLA